MNKLLLILVAVLSVGCSTPAPARSASTILVVGVGATEELAKQHGFKQAIQLHVGSVIVSDAESQSFNLIKNDILDYSAGYVSYFRIINSNRVGNQYRLDMEVTVSSSQIAERILKANIKPSNVRGEQMAATYGTYLKHTDDSAVMLSQVLKVYPKYAYNIELGEMSLKLNGSREAILVIPYSMSWNDTFIEALREFLEYSQEGSVLGFRESSPSTITIRTGTRNHAYRFLDGKKAEILNKTLGNYPVVRLVFLNKHSQKIYTKCVNINGVSKFYVYRTWRPDYDPFLYVTRLRGNFELPITPSDVGRLGEISSVIPEIISQDKC